MSKPRQIVRFMSAKEALRLLDGQTIVNNKAHRAEGGSKTDSIGFCFTSGKRSLQDSMKFLSGIVSPQVALVGVIDEETQTPNDFVKGYGVYVKPMEIPDDPIEMLTQLTEMLTAISEGKIDKKSKYNQTMRIQEWSTCSYSLDSFTKWGMYTPAPQKKVEGGDDKLQKMIEFGSQVWQDIELVAGEELMECES